MRYSTAAKPACLGETLFPVDTQIVKQPETLKPKMLIRPSSTTSSERHSQGRP